MTDIQEKLRLQSKELKDAIGQRKLAMAEYTEVSDKYVTRQNETEPLIHLCFFLFCLFPTR